MAEKNKGICYLCGNELGKTAMKTHLLNFHAEKSGQDCVLLKIEGAYDKGYWLYIDILKDKTLSALDAFLRKIWLECCGHLSEFYMPSPAKRFGYSERFSVGKSVKLRTLTEGGKLFHDYDFGSTTETEITVIGSIKRKPQKNIVRLLSRNLAPQFKCRECGAAAEYVSAEYSDDSAELFLCEECAEKYDEDYLLPVTNSPRMGQCGYTGEFDNF